MKKAIKDAKEWKSAQVKEVPPTQIPHNYRFSEYRNERFISHSDYIAYVSSSLVVEGLAVRLAMEHAIALQLRKVIFETDSLQLVSAIVEQSNISDLHGILADIYLLSSQFNSANFRYVNRSSLCFEDCMPNKSLGTL
ncbi:hypothetical protein F2Q69_00038917 [Brassica cretica]|uniref:RNase H type-1 domain-containing protein n=1 Tax=Brassica cretica TaxID=69181 RepID=A0A8S9SQY5_BRACR|nr:hypothetical protein F2Q69_00038917 [Brassica cretica]